MTFSEVDFNAFRADVKDALQAVCNKYNCDAELGNIKYSLASANLSVEFNMRGNNGESGEQIKFYEDCADYGFSPEDYKLQVNFEGTLYELVGFNARARKYPCLLREVSGDSMIKASVVAVRANETEINLTF